MIADVPPSSPRSESPETPLYFDEYYFNNIRTDRYLDSEISHNEYFGLDEIIDLAANEILGSSSEEEDEEFEEEEVSDAESDDSQVTLPYNRVPSGLRSNAPSPASPDPVARSPSPTWFHSYIESESTDASDNEDST